MSDLLYQDVIEKFAGETFDETFEFSGTIPEDTTVTARIVTALDSAGNDVTGSVVNLSVMSGTTVVVTIDTLAVDENYVIKVSVTASDASKATQIKLVNVTVPGLYI